WQFLRLEASAVTLDQTRYFIDNVGGILTVLGAILAQDRGKDFSRLQPEPPLLARGDLQHPPSDPEALAARPRRLGLPAVFHDVQLAAADAQVDRPAQAVEETLRVRGQPAVLLLQLDVEHVKADAVVVDQVAEAGQEKGVFVLLG